MADKPDDYQAYMVRLWRETSASGWRCSLEDPHTGQQLHFPTLEQLMARLLSQTADKENVMDIMILENFPEVARIEPSGPIGVKLDRAAWLEHLKNGLYKFKAAKERQQVVNLISLDSEQKLSLGVADARQAEMVAEALTSKKILFVTGKELDNGGLALVVNHEEQ